MTAPRPVDFTRYDDVQLDELRVAVLIEQERRVNLAAIPAQIQALAQQYADGGGARDDLTLEAPEPVEAPPLPDLAEIPDTK